MIQQFLTQNIAAFSVEMNAICPYMVGCHDTVSPNKTEVIYDAEIFKQFIDLHPSHLKETLSTRQNFHHIDLPSSIFPAYLTNVHYVVSSYRDDICIVFLVVVAVVVVATPYLEKS